MLKRQHPSTPPTSLASISSPSDFAETSPDSLYPHATKRRRIVAPALDGRERGLELDDDEESEKEDFDASDATTTSTDVLPHWARQTGQYKQTNALLHQLHLEHQRRAQLALLHALNQYPPRNNHDVPSSPGQLGKFLSVGSMARLPRESSPSNPIDSSRNVTVAEELGQVRARYEQHNRLLGSLVRRRKEEQCLRQE